MISTGKLAVLASERLADAKALVGAGRYGGALYLCGYAAELALKARVCENLGLDGLPENAGEFSLYKMLFTHDLTVLLQLTGLAKTIKRDHIVEWSLVVEWTPSIRYKIITQEQFEKTKETIEATERIMEALCRKS
jgi:HEPN domain-containing protein